MDPQRLLMKAQLAQNFKRADEAIDNCDAINWPALTQVLTAMIALVQMILKMFSNPLPNPTPSPTPIPGPVAHP